MNKLYFGDNLEILRDKIPSGCVDLIYLDPPFQSGKNYNQIFQPQAAGIKGATAQIKAFEDTWQWGEEAEREYQGLITGTITQEKPGQKLIDLLKAMRAYLGECPMMAYLAMMAPRLVEMRRVLKNTGSVYLHCDSTASHYLKLLMDAIFEFKNMRNEIIWQKIRTEKSQSNQFAKLHDIIFFYTKSEQYAFNQSRLPLSQEYIDKYYNQVEPKTGRRYQLISFLQGGQGQSRNFGDKWLEPPMGRHWIWSQERIDEAIRKGLLVFTDPKKPRLKRYLDEYGGRNIGNIWTDIYPINAVAKERLGYPTQKPEALLERIIKASSNEGDLVLDPFCGCGTTVAVAQRTNRKWIGIDVTYLAIDIIKKRLEKNGIKEGVDFGIDGEPTDAYSAEMLAKKSPFDFQYWCLSRLDATPSPTKSGDQGVDGIINFPDPTKPDKFGKGIVSVKGTQAVNPAMVRDLKGTIASQKADFGILITLKNPTQGMTVEAVKEGMAHYEYSKGTKQYKIPKIQILTVDDLFKKPIPVKLPPVVMAVHKDTRQSDDKKWSKEKQAELELQ